MLVVDRWLCVALRSLDVVDAWLRILSRCMSTVVASQTRCLGEVSMLVVDRWLCVALRSLDVVDAWLRILSSPPCVGHLGLVVYVHSGGVPDGLRAS